MASTIYRLEEKRELSHEDAHKALGGHAHNVLRVDVGKGATTIYFAADKADSTARALIARATEVKLADVIRT